MAELGGKIPLALRLGKQFSYRMINLPFTPRFAHRSEGLARLSTSADPQEGVAAFLNKGPSVVCPQNHMRPASLCTLVS